jgi:hypothetical protein
MNDFSRKTLRALSLRGISLVGLTVIPDMASEMPFACGQRGYIIDDNGTGRVRSFLEVLALAEKKRND